MPKGWTALAWRRTGTHLTCGCLLLLAGAGRATETPYSPDPKGFIRDWLIIGPYPSTDAGAEPTGFADDLLTAQGGEANVEPYPGLRDSALFVADKAKLIAGIGSTNQWGFTETRSFDIQWEPLHWTDASPVVDLNERFAPIKDHMVAYAACRVVSPGPQKVQVRLGSDDDYKLYVNHAFIGGLSVCRGTTPDSNIHLVNLQKGANLILLKVVDRIGGHGFCLAITDPKGGPAEGLHVVLDDPKRKIAAECAGIGQVDAMDGGAFARMGLEGDAPYFPGPHRVALGLGYEKRVDVNLELLVSDAADQPLFRRDMTATLAPDTALVLNPDIDCARPGPLKIAAVIKAKDSGALLGLLKAEVSILAPAALAAQQEDLVRDEQKLQAATVDLQGKLQAKTDELAQLRGEIAAQYERIEMLYEQRHAALATAGGDAARSIDEPFEPVETPRATLCLNSDAWEIAAATKRSSQGFDDQQPPEAGWTRTRVPIECYHEYFRGRNVPVKGKGDPFYGPSQTLPCGGDYVLPDARTSQGVWYRLRFDLPDGWETRDLTLSLNNTNTRVRAFLNGTLIGEDTAWCGPMRFALGSAVKPRDNVLAVYAGADRTLGPARRDLTEEMWGLAGDVVLEAAAPLAVSDTWIISSYREARFEARTWVRNQTGKTQTFELRHACVRDGRVRFRPGTRTVSVNSGADIEVRISQPWANPALWGIGGKYGDPTLYTLVTDVVQGGKVVDRAFTRFGFREFWVEGSHFYLNGKRIFLQGDVGHFRMNVRRHLDVMLPLLRADHINMIRSHQGNPFSYNATELPEVADELGMLVCAQMYPIIHPWPLAKDPTGKGRKDGYLSVEEFLAHPVHFENLKNYARWVRMMRNHPSVVVYSPDNEIFTQAWDTPEQLEYNVRGDRIGAYYEKYVKALDPTRVLTRDGDEGTWGHKGKWQEEPPCDTANYHYPDFHISEFVQNWETVYDGRPALFGETLYHSYGAWDGWVGAIPAQVAAKASRVREVAALYRDLEVPGAIYMGLSLDGFIELDPDGCGPWRITPQMLEEYKANSIVKAMPRYPYIPVPWPSLSGPGYKKEFAMITAGVHGDMGINWFDAKTPTHVRNAVNDAYRDSLTPMPPLKASRAPEFLVRVVRNGAPVPFAQVFAIPRAGQATAPVGVTADAQGTAWFVLPEAKAFLVRAGGAEQAVEATEVPNDPPTPGFEYLKTIEIVVP